MPMWQSIPIRFHTMFIQLFMHKSCLPTPIIISTVSHFRSRMVKAVIFWTAKHPSWTFGTLLKPILPPQTYDLLFTVNSHERLGSLLSISTLILTFLENEINGVGFNGNCDYAVWQSRTPPLYIKDIGGFRDKSARWDLYLPKRSIIVLSREARYNWIHVIVKKKRDYVPLSIDQVTPRPDTNSSDTSSSTSFQWYMDRPRNLSGYYFSVVASWCRHGWKRCFLISFDSVIWF